MKLSYAAPALAFVPNVHAWGALGHETVAYIATNFVDPATETYFQAILNNRTSSYLAGVAIWADSFRYTSAGRFSAPFHFIDAEDSPPSSCGVKYSRDCGKTGCVVGAIQNYTSQLLDTQLDSINRYIAAKFIIHFVGDIHQPLHDENVDRGGNGILVNFTGIPTNLHAIWDTNMPEKLVGGYALADAQGWANTLTAAIKTGAYKSQAASWLDGIDLSDPVTTSLAWAEESNAFVCTTVMPDGISSVQGKELSGDYYESCVPVIQLQIAKAGYRLAAWLNLIAKGTKTEL
jgi:hypothetical protein